MTSIEQRIEDMAFWICADIQHGIRPESWMTGRKWLRCAIAWARRHGNTRLERILLAHLDAAWPKNADISMSECFWTPWAMSKS